MTSVLYPEGVPYCISTIELATATLGNVSNDYSNSTSISTFLPGLVYVINTWDGALDENTPTPFPV